MSRSPDSVRIPDPPPSPDGTGYRVWTTSLRPYEDGHYRGWGLTIAGLSIECRLKHWGEIAQWEVWHAKRA